MSHITISRALFHHNSLKLLFSLILFLGLIGCSSDNTTTPTTTTTPTSPSSTTSSSTTTSSTTTTTNPLQVTGIADDTTAHASKTWNWGCDHESGDSDDEDCEFRFAINQSNNYEFSKSDEYEDVKTATKSRGENGTYYLHVQAKNANDHESEVETVSFILEGATTRTLRVTGIADDTEPQSSKTWTWTCSDTPCEFRFEINQNHNYEFDANDSYNQTVTTSKTSATGQGTFYLHVQAKNTDDNEESAIKTVSFILENLRITGLGK